MSPQAKRRTPYSSRDDLDGLGNTHEYDYSTHPHTFIAPPGPLPPYAYSPPCDYPRSRVVYHNGSPNNTNNIANNHHTYRNPKGKGTEAANNYPVNNAHPNQSRQDYSSDPRLNNSSGVVNNDSVRYDPSPGSQRRLPRSQSPHNALRGSQPSGRVASSTALLDEDREHSSPALPPRDYISDGNISQSISVTV